MIHTTPSLYLDYAAAAPIWPEVHAAMREHEHLFGNPSSQHTSGRKSQEALMKARRALAQRLGCHPTELIFTSGATESNNLALQGVVRANQHTATNLMISAIEHPSIRDVAAFLASQGVRITTLPVNATGEIDLQALDAALDTGTALVSVIAASNEIGTIQPLGKIRERIEQFAQRTGHRPLLHTDASQLAAWHQRGPNQLSVDLMTISGAKLGAGQGTGALYVARGATLAPLIIGGGQQYGRRGGTESVRSAIALERGLSTTWDVLGEIGDRVRKQRDTLVGRICESLPGATVNHDPRGLPNIISLTVPGIEASSAVAALDAAGIAASAGAACSSAKESLDTLLALGRTPAEARSTIRLSLGWMMPENALSGAAATIRDVLAAEQGRGARVARLARTGQALAQAYASRYTTRDKEDHAHHRHRGRHR